MSRWVSPTTALLLLALLASVTSCSLGASYFTHFPCSLFGPGEELSWHDPATWTAGRLPNATDRVLVSRCHISIATPVHVDAVTINGGGQLSLLNTNLTVSGSISVDYGAVTLAGRDSAVTAPQGLLIYNSVLTGSGTIIGNVSVSGQGEIDVLQLLTGLRLPTLPGSLTIRGNLIMEQRDPALPSTTNELYHATVALGLFVTNGIKSNSKLRVHGTVFVELMSLSLLFSPNKTAYGETLPSDLLVADGGFVFDSSINETRKISTLVINRTGPGNFDSIIFAYGHHVGRYTPTPDVRRGTTPAGGTNSGDPGDTGPVTITVPPTSGCSQPSGSSLVILFGGSQCSTSSPQTACGSGQIYDSSTQACIPQCPDMTCGGHGTCIASNGAAACDCDFGWTGANCQLGDCPLYEGAVCNLRGTCNLPAAAGQPATCSCQIGFSEPDCRPPIVLTPTPQGGNGTTQLRCGSITCSRAATACSASNTSCVCVQGFGGDACEQAQCPNQCSGHGVCDGSRVPPVCQCTGNWLGDDCNTAGGASATDNNNAANSGGLASQSIAGISAPAFIGIMAAVGLIVIVSAVVIVVVVFNKRAKRAVRPFSERQITRDDDL